MDEADFQQLLDELTDAKNNLVQHNGYFPRLGFRISTADSRPRFGSVGEWWKQAQHRQVTDGSDRAGSQRKHQKQLDCKVDTNEMCLTFLGMQCTTGEQVKESINRKASGWELQESSVLTEAICGSHTEHQRSSV